MMAKRSTAKAPIAREWSRRLRRDGCGSEVARRRGSPASSRARRAKTSRRIQVVTACGLQCDVELEATIDLITGLHEGEDLVGSLQLGDGALETLALAVADLDWLTANTCERHRDEMSRHVLSPGSVELVGDDRAV